MLDRADLHPYQQRTVAMLAANPKLYVAMDMGLGKTVSVLTALADLKASGARPRALVIAPKRVAESVWCQEVEKWAHLKGLRCSLISGTPVQRARAIRPDVDICIVGRDNTKWLIGHLRQWPFDTLVIDEASSFKDPSSKRFKALKKIRQEFERCWLLSGTPAPNSLVRYHKSS